MCCIFVFLLGEGEGAFPISLQVYTATYWPRLEDFVEMGGDSVEMSRQ